MKKCTSKYKHYALLEFSLLFDCALPLSCFIFFCSSSGITCSGSTICEFRHHLRLLGIETTLKVLLLLTSTADGGTNASLTNTVV
jgi:hypothetical protein